MSVDNYINLVTSEHRNKPNFIKNLKIPISGLVLTDNVLLSMIEKFDLDEATGVQLDVIGKWVGIKRSIIISGETVTLPDESYKLLIRARIAANRWDGTIPNAYEIWETVFPDSNILIQDNQNMSMDVAIIGGPFDELTVELIKNGYLTLKPEGVSVNYNVIPTGDDLVFAWDVQDELFDGWEAGYWVTII